MEETIQNAVWRKVTQGSSINFKDIIQNNYLNSGYNFHQTSNFMEFPTVNGIAGKSPNEWSGDHMMQQLQQTPHPYLLHPYPSDRIEDILVPATGINNLASTAGSVLAIAMDDPIDRLAKARQDEANKMKASNPLSGRFAQNVAAYMGEHPELSSLYHYLSIRQREELFKHVAYHHPEDRHTIPLPPEKETAPHDLASNQFHHATSKRKAHSNMGTNVDHFSISGADVHTKVSLSETNSKKEKEAIVPVSGTNYEKQIDEERDRLYKKQRHLAEENYSQDVKHETSTMPAKETILVNVNGGDSEIHVIVPVKQTDVTTDNILNDIHIVPENTGVGKKVPNNQYQPPLDIGSDTEFQKIFNETFSKGVHTFFGEHNLSPNRKVIIRYLKKLDKELTSKMRHERSTQNLTQKYRDGGEKFAKEYLKVAVSDLFTRGVFDSMGIPQGLLRKLYEHTVQKIVDTGIDGLAQAFWLLF